MTPIQQAQLDIAADYELTAAWCLANGMTRQAEQVLAWADATRSTPEGRAAARAALTAALNRPKEPTT